MSNLILFNAKKEKEPKEHWRCPFLGKENLFELVAFGFQELKNV